MKSVLFLALLLLGVTSPRPETIAANDNRVPAGTLNNHVLSVSIETATGLWYPDGERAPGITVQALRERGHALQIPGPLIRVPLGTLVEARIRNTLATTLAVHGWVDRPASNDAAVRIVPGEERLVRFRANAPGTYYYWATTTDATFDQRLGADSQLSGAIVVDGAKRNAVKKADRIFVIGLWNNVRNPDRTVNKLYELFTINGRAWPSTERLNYRQGEAVEWRWINATAAFHPLHLHGFYFLIDSRGDALSDGLLPNPERAVTELLGPGRTFAISFKASRAGNWLFHCHLPYHAIGHVPFAVSLLGRPALDRETIEHGTAMGGLILGLTVHPRDGAVIHTAAPVRRFRLVAERAPENAEHVAAFHYVLVDRGRTELGPGALGPTIVLTRGIPAGITVENRFNEPTAVHWHGIEMTDSYYDGVPGFSGYGARIEPMIMPGAAFEARFTPPRAGTFIYHTHMDDVWQMRAGLTGPLVVLPPGQRFEPAVDHVVMITTPRDWHDQLKLYVNGFMTPAPLTIQRGIPQRFRLINMTAIAFGASVSLESKSGTVLWRPIARDGAEFPMAKASLPVSAVSPITIGQTRDFTFTADTTADLRLTIRFGPNSPYIAMVPIHVVNGAGAMRTSRRPSRARPAVTATLSRPAIGGRTTIRERRRRR